MKLSLTIIFTVLFAFLSSAQDSYFLSWPCLSPNGESIVFSFEGDLWQAEVNSGQAYRLTAMQGFETAAKYSPDGKWIAFTGTQFGNADVFLMPAGGGNIKQLTFHAAADDMETWAWNSSEVLFRSNRFNSASVYQVPVAGGTPGRLFTHYFNVIHSIAIHPTSGEVFFNDTWESLGMSSRKRYVGEYDPDIQSYNPSNEQYKKYTTWEGKDMWATIDLQGNVYFVSDENTGQYNLFTLEDGSPKALTKFESSIYHPQVCANGEFVAFEKDYQLHLYEVATGKVNKLQVRLLRNELLPSEQSFKIAGKISGFDLSPDKKKLAFISRGALFVSDIKGKFTKKIKTGEVFERVQEVHWLKDSTTLLFSMTWQGYTNWYKISADSNSKAIQLSSDLRNNRNLVINKDMTQAAYLSGRDELRIIDLNDFSEIHTLKDEFWGFQNGAIDFSPDGKYLAYTTKKDFEDEIFVLNIKDKKTINITQSGVSESGVKWGPEGKYLYMVTNRLKPSFSRGAGDVNLYRLALEKHDKEFKTDHYEKLFKKDTTKDTSKLVDISINTDNIWERFERVSPGFGSQGSAVIIKKGSKTTLIYSSNHDKGKWGLWKTEIEPFEKNKTESITGISGRVAIVARGEKVFGLSSGIIYEINLKTKKATKVVIEKSFTRSFTEEFKQMFMQTWSNIEENFYHDDLHGEDWKEHKKYYQRFVSKVNNRGDFRALMTNMLGELNSSHMGFTSRGPEEKSFMNYATLECGIVYKDDQAFVVDRVAKRGPADKFGIDIQEGDKLLAVNGRKVSDYINRNEIFYKPAMEKEITLTFSRMGEEITHQLHPQSYRTLSGCFYNEWIDDNKVRVDELSNKQITYAHMKNMGGGELNNFIMSMTRNLKGKKGLILDLRYNTGGNVHDEVLRFLQQRTYLQWKSREGKLSNQSNFSPSDFPIVLLINEQSLSDAEMTAAGFKELGLGKVIGVETYRWIIFTSGMGLVDGSYHRLPGWGCYTMDGVNLERSGVSPDIVVYQSFKDRLAGKDPQIEKAVEEILNQAK